MSGLSIQGFFSRKHGLEARAVIRILLTVATLAATAVGQSAKGEWFMYVGTYTNGGSKGIYGFRFQSTSGKMTPIGLVAETSNPTFLAIHPTHRFLYAVNEVDKYEGQAAG